MKCNPRFLPLTALLLGVVGAVLRRIQLAVGFEPDTGLAIEGSWINILVPAFLIGTIIILILLTLPHKEKNRSFGGCFCLPEGMSLMFLISAAFLFMAGGGMYLMYYLQSGGPLLVLAAGVIALFTAVTSIYTVRCWRQDETVEGILLLPPVLLFLFLLLSAYLAHGTFPVLARYGVEILGIAALLYGFYQISAAGFRQGSSSALLRGICLGIALGVTAAADLLSLGESLTLAAGAVMLLAFGLNFCTDKQ